MTALVAALAMSALALGFTAAAQASTTTWTSANSIDNNGGTVLSDSCASTSQCTAVDFDGQEVTFDPATGAVQTRADVDGIYLLRAVSCPSTGLCAAVDDHGNAVSFDPANGQIIAGPTLIDQYNSFYGLSCASTGQCTALDRNGGEVTFNPQNMGIIGTGSTGLGGGSERLSCPATTQCTAVNDAGDEATFNPQGPIAPVVTNIDTSADHALYVVSCPETTQCTAIDNGGNEVTFNPQAVVTPTAYEINAASNYTDEPAGTTAIDLYAVSCYDAADCTAVDRQGHEISFDPNAGAAPTVVNRAGVANEPLHSVSCSSDTLCTAVDNTGGETSFNPQTTTGSSANPIAAANAFRGVSCASDTQCTGVDIAGQTVTFNPTNGAIISGAFQFDLNNVPEAVACVSTTRCTAVDWTGDAFDYNPTNPGAGVNALALDSGALISDVVCPTAGQCTAVDSSGNEITYNPQSNVAQAPVNVDGTFPNYLEGVACPSAGQCTAVDYAGRAITFNPTNGAVSNTATIDGAGVLNGISCPSTGQCTAVDANGHAITFNPTLGSGATTNDIDSGVALSGVSCPTTGLCFAAAENGSAVQFNPNGTGGTIQPINGIGALEAITCTSALQCVAVDNSGQEAQGTSPAPPAVPVDATPPTITGTTTQGQTLTEGHGGWTNGPTGYAYQWEDCNSSGTGCTAIAGATGETYTLTAADVGHTIRVLETASDAGGSGTAATSANTGLVAPAPVAVAPSVTLAAPLAKLVSHKISSKHHEAVFKFKATGAVSRYECALVLKPTRKHAKTPAPKYALCGSSKTYKKLKDGKYVFYVRALGPGGIGATKAYSFRIG